MPHKVAILDDEVGGISGVVEEILAARGFKVDTVHSQKKAKWLLARTEYTVAIDAGADMFVLKSGPERKLELAVAKFCGGSQEPD